MEEEVTEEDLQRAFFHVAVDEMLTIMMVPDTTDRAYVPEHWREAALERALQDK